jgi:hypothetical protein
MSDFSAANCTIDIMDIATNACKIRICDRCMLILIFWRLVSKINVTYVSFFPDPASLGNTFYLSRVHGNHANLANKPKVKLFILRRIKIMSVVTYVGVA